MPLCAWPAAKAARRESAGTNPRIVIKGRQPTDRAYGGDMGVASYLEDLEDRRIEAQLLRGVTQFEEHQRARLRSGTLSEDSLQRDLEALRQRIVAPLEAIKAKAGAQDLELGNQLLKLQAEINTASGAMEELLAQVDRGPGAQEPDGDAVASFMVNFAVQYRLLLRVLQATAQPLSTENRNKLERIRSACEWDLQQIKALARRLAARDQGIALLYRKVEELQKELDRTQRPMASDMDGTGYESFDRYTKDKGIRQLKR